MSKVTHCKQCGVEIPSFIQSVQSDADAATWVQGGFCSRKCHKIDLEESPKKKNKPKEEVIEPLVKVEEKVEAPVEKAAKKVEPPTEKVVEKTVEGEEKIKPEEIDLGKYKIHDLLSAEEYIEVDIDIMKRVKKAKEVGGFLVQKAKKAGIEYLPGFADLFQAKNKKGLLIPQLTNIAMALSLLGLFFLGIILGASAIITASLALKKIKEAPKQFRGIQRTYVALGIGLADIILFIILSWV